MSKCSKCNQNGPKLPDAVLEVISKEAPVLFHKVIFPASIGDDTTNPADTLNYKNVLLVYEANQHVYLYSSDGVPTLIAKGDIVTEQIEKMLEDLGVKIESLESKTQELSDSLATTNLKLEETTQNLSTLTDTVNGIDNDVTKLEGVVADETDARREADANLESQITQANATISGIQSNLDQEVEQTTAFTNNDSTVEVTHGRVNLKTNETSSTTEALPVASSTDAGIMNAATYNAIQNNSEDVDSIMNGAVALSDLPATPTQADLTNQWKTATGKDELINRASIYDVTNQKLWYYYTNTNTWYSVGTSEGSSVQVNQATNDSLGIVKGSTNPGQNFVEADGSMSVVGWDSLLARITTLENNTVKLYNEYSTASDGANTAAFINNKLNGDIIEIGRNANANEFATVVIGSGASSNAAGLAIGDAATATASNSMSIGNNASVTASNSMSIGSTRALTVARGLQIGPRSHVTFADGIALGYNTVTTRSDEFITGANPMFHANVKTGELPTDAVNVQQLEDYVAEHSGGNSNTIPIYSVSKNNLPNALALISYDTIQLPDTIPDGFTIYLIPDADMTTSYLYTGYKLTINGTAYDMDIQGARISSRQIPYKLTAGTLCTATYHTDSTGASSWILLGGTYAITGTDIASRTITSSNIDFTTYSTAPIQVGTWIDGKPIYRVVLAGTLNTGGNHAIDISGLQCDRAISLSGTIHSQYGSVYPLGAYSSENNYSNIGLADTHKTLNIIYAPVAYNSQSYTVILEYTKVS